MHLFRSFLDYHGFMVDVSAPSIPFQSRKGSGIAAAASVVDLIVDTTADTVVEVDVAVDPVADVVAATDEVVVDDATPSPGQCMHASTGPLQCGSMVASHDMLNLSVQSTGAV